MLEGWDIVVEEVDDLVVDDFAALSDEAETVLDRLELAFGTDWAMYFVTQVGWKALCDNAESVVQFVSWLYDPTTEIPSV